MRMVRKMLVALLFALSLLPAWAKGGAEETFAFRFRAGNDMFFLTSSMRHPKLVSKQWGDTLVPFHEHRFAYDVLVERQLYLDCCHGLGHGKHFVHAHVDTGQFEQAFQLLVDFQRHEADADMRLYPSAGEVEHGAHLYL